MSEPLTGRARIVLTLAANRYALRSEDGNLPLEYCLFAMGFEPGDLIEIRLVERCPEFGTQQWLAAQRRG